MLKYGGQPHLGKKLYLTRTDLERIYGAEKLERFRSARCAQDPSGKFLNEFTEPLFL